MLPVVPRRSVKLLYVTLLLTASMSCGLTPSRAQSKAPEGQSSAPTSEAEEKSATKSPKAAAARREARIKLSPESFNGPYPRLYVTDDRRDQLKHEIQAVPFKRKIYESLVASVQKYVDRHQTDPQWILSRLPMNRTPGKRYTGYIFHGAKDGKLPYLEGYGDAPVPTLRYEHDKGLIYRTENVDAAPLDDVTPNGNDTFNVMITEPDGSKHLKAVDVHLAALTFRATGEHIRNLARTSAYLYWLTGDEKYAKFAGDILRVVADGVAQMPNGLKNEGKGQPATYGYPAGNIFTNMELAKTLAQGMDYLHDYFVKQRIDLTNYETAMKTLASFMGPETTPHNISVGANLTKLQLALCMSGDKEWSEAYLKETLDGVAVQAKSIDKKGVWIEPCAYSDYTIAWFMKIVWIGYNNHLDVLKRFPQVFRAGTGQLRDLFPNGIYIGDGDNWSANPRVWVIEPALTIARLTNDVALETKLSQYINLMIDNGIYKQRGDGADQLDVLNVFLGELKYPSTGSLPLATSVRNDTRETLALRSIPPLPPLTDNSKDALKRRNDHQSEYSLQAMMYGYLNCNHRHQQGLTTEFYACGNVLALDPGPGEDAYSGPIHTGFSTRWAAHNTVVVDGKSTGAPHLTASVMEPEEDAVPVSLSFSFIKGDSVDPNSKKDQRRVVLISRTSPTSGYFVDVYHSAGEKKNEYLYHNVGVSAEVLSGGRKLKSRPAPDELNDDEKRAVPALVGYRYFGEKQIYPDADKDLEIRFDVPREKDAEPVRMSMYLPGGPGRSLIMALSPGIAAHRAYGGYVDKPIPTAIVRQSGEAWTRPFVAVFEPYRGEHKTARSVTRFGPQKPDPLFTGVSVELDGVPGVAGVVNDKFLTTLDTSVRFEGEKWSFKGLCAAVRTLGGKPAELYLGSGDDLSFGGYRLTSTSGAIAACLEVRHGEPTLLSATSLVRVTLPLSGKHASPPRSVKVVRDSQTQFATDVSLSDPGSEGSISATFPAVSRGAIVIEW